MLVYEWIPVYIWQLYFIKIDCDSVLVQLGAHGSKERNSQFVLANQTFIYSIPLNKLWRRIIVLASYFPKGSLYARPL